MRTFSQFRLQIWNENKILRILVPILTYFNTKYFFQNTGQIFFPSNRSIWVPKNAEFYAYSKSEDEIEKKCIDKKLFLKNLEKSSFLIITFLSCAFFQFCLWIWNQRKILRFLVPILTYLKKKVFSSIFSNMKWSKDTPKLTVHSCAAMLGRNITNMDVRTEMDDEESPANWKQCVAF